MSFVRLRIERVGQRLPALDPHGPQLVRLAHEVALAIDQLPPRAVVRLLRLPQARADLVHVLYEAAELTQVVKTKKTELLFVALILRMLKKGGRSATIVPDGVLFGSSKAHTALRTALVKKNQLEAVISLPSGVFKPYAGVSTAILVFVKDGKTDHVFFYDVEADGFSLDDKRDPISDNDLPDALARWRKRSAKKDTDRTAKHFMVPVREIEELERML